MNLQKRCVGIFCKGLIYVVLGISKSKNADFSNFWSFSSISRGLSAKIKNVREKSRTTIQENCMEMLYTKFQSSNSNIEKQVHFYSKLTLKFGYILFNIGFPIHFETRGLAN